MEARTLTRAGIFAAVLAVVTTLTRYLQPALVPFSLQPLVVFLAGCLLAPSEAALAMVVYLIIGLMGVPVFSSPPFGGLIYVAKPSFGFLLGFALAAWLMSVYLTRCRRTMINLLVASLIGLVVIYAAGLPYMYLILRFYLHQSLDVWGVLKIGFIPFILFDAVKAVIAAWLGHSLSQRLGL